MARHGCSFIGFLQLISMIIVGQQLYGNFPPIKAKGIVLGDDKYVQQDVSINLNYSVFTVSEKFLSIAIDTGIMRSNWHGMNFTSEKFFTLAAALSPAFLRMSGTAADCLVYNDSPGLQTFANFTITHKDLDKVHLISSKAGWDVVFGLNVLLRERNGSWNASNAKKIMQYVGEHGYRFGWELGNEPTLFPKDLNVTISPEVLAEDFKTLRAILKSSPQFGKYLVGPDVTGIGHHSRAAMFFERFVQGAKDAIDAVTWHQYYIDGRNCTAEEFYDPRVLDHLLHELNAVNNILAKSDPGAARWLGETSSAFGGGAPGLSDRYIAGFMWLDKLGLAALLGHEIIIRQTFIRGSYSLLDADMEPNPDYWLSLLYKKLVGVKVLEVKGGLEEKRKIRVYAHCSTRKYPLGSITLLALNVHQHDPAVIKLTGELQGKAVEEYLLMPMNNNLKSKTVMLNGRALKLVDDRTLPELVPVRTTEPLILPPLTFGLYVVPEASAKACG